MGSGQPAGGRPAGARTGRLVASDAGPVPVLSRPSPCFSRHEGFSGHAACKLWRTRSTIMTIFGLSMFENPTQQTIQNPDHIDAAVIRASIAAGRQVTVQFDTLGEPEPLLAELDALAASSGPALTIRIYGDHARVFDAHILRALPHVSSLSIDFHQNALHLEALGDMPRLRRLRLGVYELAQTDILRLKNLRKLDYLYLDQTAKNNLDLAPLRHFSQLSSLHIDGHSQQIDTLASLPALKELSLCRIKNKVGLDFVSHIGHLEALRLQLGGRSAIQEINAPLLKKLEVLRVRGLETLGDMGRFPLLRKLWVEDQAKLAKIEFSNNRALEQVHLHTCKTLASLDGLNSLDALRLLSVSETMLDIEAMLEHGLPASLSHLHFRTGKAKLDEAIAAQLAQRGYSKQLLPF